MTIWRPDTCACAVEYTDDGNLAYVRSLTACPHHTPHTSGHLAQMLAENRQKNDIVNQIIARTPTAGTRFTVDPQNGDMRVWGSVIPSDLLSSLRTQYPKVSIQIDPTLGPDNPGG